MIFVFQLTQNANKGGFIYDSYLYISYEELVWTSDEAYVCFNQPHAIRGYKEGDTYTLVNGNHRVFLAQKLGMDVPYVVLGKGRHITLKELVRSGVLGWNSMPKSEKMIDMTE